MSPAPALCSPVARVCRFVLIAVLSGCATSTPTPLPREEIVLKPIPTTALEALLAPTHAAYGSDSGFELLDTGRDALLSRAAMIESAERSIDAQYYIWNSDASGLYLANRLLLAAERGVRVRLLLDDINVAGRDAVLAALDAHPLIDIRIYNPFAQRRGLRKAFGFLWEFTRLNRRMHNKSLTVDEAFTVVGGRNIGDEYFDAAEHLNFRDRDVLAIGPVVAQTVSMFEIFWSSPMARPITEITGEPRAPAEAERQRLLDEATRHLEGLFGPLPDSEGAGLAMLRQTVAGMVRAPARLVFDSPPASEDLGRTSESQPSARELVAIARAATQEILIESAYLVMDDDTMDGVRALRERGVRVRALTNSLASNDVTANHAAYARRREAMLASGVEISELRPDAESCARLVRNPAACGESHIFGLHAKTFVFDRRTVYVGSLNLNLRSRYLNAESGMVIESPALAARIAADIEENMSPANSWQLQRSDADSLRWLERDADGGTRTTHDHDPQTSWSRRSSAAAISALPLEKYL